MTATPDHVARSRFTIISIVRVAGVALMLLGMGIIATRLIGPADVVGGLIFVAGFADAMIVPRILARKWRTPPQP